MALLSSQGSPYGAPLGGGPEADCSQSSPSSPLPVLVLGWARLGSLAFQGFWLWLGFGFAWIFGLIAAGFGLAVAGFWA